MLKKERKQMKYGKNINILPIDGYLKCTLANWTGVVYKIPRTELENCKERDDLKQSGVYVLFGTNEEKEEWRQHIVKTFYERNLVIMNYYLEEIEKIPF